MLSTNQQVPVSKAPRTQTPPPSSTTHVPIAFGSFGAQGSAWAKSAPTSATTPNVFADDIKWLENLHMAKSMLGGEKFDTVKPNSVPKPPTPAVKMSTRQWRPLEHPDEVEDTRCREYVYGLYSEVNELRADVGNLEMLVSELNTEIESQSERRLEAEANAESRKRRISEDVRTINALRSELDAVLATSKKLTLDLQKSQSELMSTQRVLGELRSTFDQQLGAAIALESGPTSTKASAPAPEREYVHTPQLAYAPTTRAWHAPPTAKISMTETMDREGGSSITRSVEVTGGDNPSDYALELARKIRNADIFAPPPVRRTLPSSSVIQTGTVRSGDTPVQLPPSGSKFPSWTSLMRTLSEIKGHNVNQQEAYAIAKSHKYIVD